MMIRVQSFAMESQYRLIPIEVEVALWPGLPGIHFLGLPDQNLKESALRIKSAIKSSGFQFPRSKQILVNLRPSHIKKNSRGVELAVATAFLWITDQVKKEGLLSESTAEEQLYIYGELSLDGQVYSPEDLRKGIGSDFQGRVLTGEVSEEDYFFFPLLTLRNLAGLQNPVYRESREEVLPDFERPFLEMADRRFDTTMARTLQIVALGEHPTLLAGPSGSGKTYWAQTLPALLREPDEQIKKQILQKNFLARWRPIVQPHHSIPIMSMLGGGGSPGGMGGGGGSSSSIDSGIDSSTGGGFNSSSYINRSYHSGRFVPGEISRAHGGVLILDEFLEFHSKVLEALREPMEEGRVRVARGGRSTEFLAQVLVIATTNLCPCGEWTPNNGGGEGFFGGSGNIKCRFSRKKCQSYGERFSGPLMDRFEMIIFTKRNAKRVITFQDILEKVRSGISFAKAQRGQSGINAKESPEILLKSFSSLCRSLLPDMAMSERRRMAMIRVARTIADLEGSEQVSGAHLQEALKYTFHDFHALSQWNME